MIKLYQYFLIENLPDFFNSEVDNILSNIDSNKGFQQKYYPEDFSQSFKENIKEYLEELVEEKIVVSERGCLNITKFIGEGNECVWHSEGGISNGLVDQIIAERQYLCLFWIRGEKNKGGAFRYLNDITGELVEVLLNPPGFIIITKDTMHSVEHYSGSEYRVSFNIDFDKKTFDIS